MAVHIVVGLTANRFAVVNCARRSLTIYAWDEARLAWLAELTVMVAPRPPAIAEEVRWVLRGHKH